MIKDETGYYHYTGCIHVHTKDSDGTATHEEVIAFGAEVGLDFLFFTDHMTLKSREAQSGYHGELFVTVGYEHNDPADKNHFLVFDSPGVYDVELPARDYVAQCAADNALGIIAHPDEKRPEGGKYPPYQWQDWTIEGYHGIEIWNQMSEWMERLEEAGPIGKVALLFSPRKFMKAPPAETLRHWDQANLTRRALGVAGVDAHAFPYRLGPKKVTIFPYKVHFRSLQNHVVLTEPLSKNPDDARVQLLTAMRSCQLYFSNRRRCDAKGFQFSASSGGSTAICGGSLESPADARLRVVSPQRAEIRLIRNGSVVLRVESDMLEYTPSEPGLYRVEVLRNGFGWIYSNHIRIGVPTNPDAK
jgi:hypothetical protein